MLASGALYFTPGEEALAREYAGSTTKTNPKLHQWLKARARGEHYGEKPPDTVKCAGRIPHGFPVSEYAGGYWVARWAPGQSAGPVTSKTSLPAACPSQTAFSLRPYQRAALNGWYQRDHRAGGVMVQPCGAGKTMLGIHIAAHTPSPVLVLVNSDDLRRQWAERFATNTDAQVVIWDNSKQVTGRVTIATLQALHRLSWGERWKMGAAHGLIIADECHRIPAVTFAEVMASLPCRGRLGLTATPTRQDGLGDWINYICGPTAWVTAAADIEQAGAILKPKIRRVETQFQPTGSNWTKIISSICQSDTRNAHIRALASQRVTRGGSVLILTDRVSHAQRLAEMIPDGVPFVGSMAKKRRREVLKSLETGAARVMCATTVADEGLDLPRLDTVILTCPSKDVQKLEQRIGRILRPHPEKLDPLVLDLVDDWGPAKGWARTRHNFYRRKGWA